MSFDGKIADDELVETGLTIQPKFSWLQYFRVPLPFDFVSATGVVTLLGAGLSSSDFLRTAIGANLLVTEEVGDTPDRGSAVDDGLCDSPLRGDPAAVKAGTGLAVGLGLFITGGELATTGFSGVGLILIGTAGEDRAGLRITG